MTKRWKHLASKNCRLARRSWGNVLTSSHLRSLREITERFQLSVSAGDLLLLDGRWYVSHAGWLGLAHRNRCAGIHVRPVLQFCDPSSDRRQRELGAFLISCNTKYSM